MKTSFVMIVASTVLAATSGCVVAPGPPAYVDGSATVYLAPTYASPGPGWIWVRHPRYGWGWRHPEHGWHRGWN
jgi:hypothetical protein